MVGIAVARVLRVVGIACWLLELLVCLLGSCYGTRQVAKVY